MGGPTFNREWLWPERGSGIRRHFSQQDGLGGQRGVVFRFLRLEIVSDLLRAQLSPEQPGFTNLSALRRSEADGLARNVFAERIIFPAEVEFVSV